MEGRLGFSSIPKVNNHDDHYDCRQCSQNHGRLNTILDVFFFGGGGVLLSW